MKEDLKEIVRQIVRENELSTEGVMDDKFHYVLERFDNYSIVSINDRKFKITGNERLKVFELKEEIVKKKGREKMPNSIIKVCKVCGTEFEVSKFNHYHDECKSCRKGKTGVIVKVCDSCGEEFEISKYTPYVNTCKDCHAKHRKDKIKSKEE